MPSTLTCKMQHLLQLHYQNSSPSMDSSSPTVHHISECFIMPESLPEQSKQPLYLSPWDLAMPCAQYIQKGLLFTKPPTFSDTKMQSLLSSLKDSLSATLIHFYPLAGRLKTLKQDDPHIYTIYVDCVDSPGAKFIHASLNLRVADILSPKDVPIIVQSFFDHDRAINHDGHHISLLTIKVTELTDGVFIGCSANHMIVDGTSYWHFFNTWSEIFNSGEKNVAISRPPVLQRWMPPGHGPILSLPYNDSAEFVQRFKSPPLRERMFHFSAESLAKLKAKANSENNSFKISSLQAVSALMWRCVTRARNFPPEKETSCRMAANNRTRLSPRVSENYVGNCHGMLTATATAGDLLRHGLGWAAWKLHQVVKSYSDEKVRKWIDYWIETRFVYQMSFFDPSSVMMGSSPRFDMYGPEFGLGKAVAIRSGYSHKVDGKVTLYPGSEGGGSMDLETCLSPDSMARLEEDVEFMEYVTL